jgi:hypothetical protein
MLSHTGTTAFLEVYLSYLRVLGNIVNVDVVNIAVEHEFANGLLDNGPSTPTPTRTSTSSGEEKYRRSGGVSCHKEMQSDLICKEEKEKEMLGDLARTIWEGVEGGGIATIGWPARRYMMVTAARGASTLSLLPTPVLSLLFF